jgi:hypothetical protein
MVETGVVYAGSRILRHVCEDMEKLARFGATFVAHTFSEEDYGYYYGRARSKLIYPSLDTVKLDADGTMKAIVKASHNAGLGVWLDPWCIGHVFGADTYSLFVATHPEAVQADQLGRPMPAACLNRPAFRDFVHLWIDAAVALEADMLVWDEPHLCIGEWFAQPERWGCHCALCQDLYRRRHGEDMPTAQDDPGVQAFQAWTLLDFMRDIIGYAKSQGAKNGVCLLPTMHQPGAPTWEEVAELPGLDSLGTDPYPFPYRASDWRQFVIENAQNVVDLCRRHGLENQLWFQSFGLTSDPVQLEYLETGMMDAVEQGIDTVGVWGFEGSADMSYCACEQPEVVWQAVGRAFRRLRALP